MERFSLAEGSDLQLISGVFPLSIPVPGLGAPQNSAQESLLGLGLSLSFWRSPGSSSRWDFLLYRKRTIFSLRYRDV